MRDAVDLPRVLGVHELPGLGLTRSSVRHAVTALGWQRPARGVVFTRPDPLTRDDWVQVGLALAGTGAALSGWDAVRTRGIGANAAPTFPVLVLARGGNQRREGGVLVRPTSRPYRTSLLPAEHPTLPFVPIAHPARAVADTALTYRTRAPVRALVTSAIQRGLCRPEDLVAEYESGPRGGSYWLRRALEDVLVNAHSIAEAEAAEVLTKARVPSFELNVDIVDVSGRLLGTADVLWRSLRAVGEIQSRAFHFDEESWNRLDGPAQPVDAARVGCRALAAVTDPSGGCDVGRVRRRLASRPCAGARRPLPSRLRSAPSAARRTATVRRRVIDIHFRSPGRRERQVDHGTGGGSRRHGRRNGGWIVRRGSRPRRPCSGRRRRRRGR